MQRVLISTFLATAVFLGCDSGTEEGTDSTNDSDNNNTAWLVRAVISDSDFAPVNIENAVDNIVLALNQQTQDTNMKLSFIPKALTGYFATTVEGANDAFGELGVVNTVVAPVPTDGSTDIDLIMGLQISYVEEHTEDEYNGIGIAPFASDLIPSIDAAVDSGMTVITFDSDEPESKRQIYVGTINAEAGKTAGETMAGLLSEETGNVVVLGSADESWTDGYSRTDEARKVLEDKGYTVAVQDTIWSDLGDNVEALKETMEALDPSPIGCLGVFANAYACAVAAEELGIIDDIAIAAFDFEPETLVLMEEGKIQVTHVQRQYYMGYLVPYLLYASNVLGVSETKALISDIMVDDDRVDTGLDVVAADKLDDYTLFLESLGLL